MDSKHIGSKVSVVKRDSTQKSVAEQMGFDFSQKEEPTLANFIEGDNAEALGVLKKMKEGNAPQFIYLWGESGVGKTHLAKAFGVPGEKVPIFDGKTLFYAVDDVQTLTDEELERLFILMNEVRNSPACRLLVTGNSPVQALTLRDDVKSRLAWGLTFEIKRLDEAKAREAFIREAQKRGIEITGDMRQWIATYMPRDIGSLSTLLEAIDHYAIVKKRKVTLPLLTQLVREKEAL